MIIKLNNVECFAPSAMGKQCIVIAGSKITAITPQCDLCGSDVQVIDGQSCLAVPGLVDSLAHITGGGGEGGFVTRTPELNAMDAIRAGVTTLIGVLGTDAITRSLPNLLAKTHALEAQGLSCFAYTGSYQIPPRTLLNDVMEDLMLIDKFIGVGEVAIADHRSSQPTCDEMKKLAAQARVGGMLSAKAGIVSVHVGAAKSGLTLLHNVVENSDIPITQFYPTHINRNHDLLKQGFDFVRRGGFIDFTTSTTVQELAQGEVKCSRAAKLAIEQGVNVEHITFSSDANASLPVFDERGECCGLGVGRIASLLDEIRDAVLIEKIDLSTALSLATRNPARILKLSQKGELRVGGDADVLLLDRNDLRVRAVFARGVCLWCDEKLNLKTKRIGPFLDS